MRLEPTYRVDQGFTQLPAPDGDISVGAVVHNSSDHIAYRTEVVFRLFDESNAELPEQGPQYSRQEVPVVMPGERAGVGMGSSKDVRVSSVSIEPDTTTWLPENALGSFTPSTTEYLRTIRYVPRQPTRVDVHYVEKARNCRALENRKTTVVLRDAQGEIVGESWPTRTSRSSRCRLTIRCRRKAVRLRVRRVRRVSGKRGSSRRSNRPARTAHAPSCTRTATSASPKMTPAPT